MFQTFKETADPSQGRARLAALRGEIAARQLDGFLVPRADAHQGEYAAPCDERLAWLTGFTGSAGFAAILDDTAGIFVDGRYRTQIRGQADMDHFTPVNWPEVQLADWLLEHGPTNAKIGFDPWLHTAGEIKGLREKLGPDGVKMVPVENLVDVIWTDRPGRPVNPIKVHPDRFAGESNGKKRSRLGATLEKAGHHSAILTLPDSICWLLNIRGSDIAHNPVVQGFAVLHWEGTVHLGNEVEIHPYDGFLEYLSGCRRRTFRTDPKSVPQAVQQHLQALADDAARGIKVVDGEDPCNLPKACKNDVEIAASREAHLRDAAAMVEFLAWFDAASTAGITEIEAVTRLEGARRAANSLQDISFETIMGSGPNGAIMHYRVTEGSNRTMQDGELVVIDSGGQYLDGTTDVTRTVPVGTPTAEHRRCFTRVLQGMIAISRLRFPKGRAGIHMDAIARYPLWLDGLDFDHGVGHGVGAYLSVHEGPQSLNKINQVAIQPGMILSNEPGYYRVGEFGIRIENLIVAMDAPPLPGADDREMLAFDTLTWVPIDRRLIDESLLNGPERDWINNYHADVARKVSSLVGETAQAWLETATQPI